MYDKFFPRLSETWKQKWIRMVHVMQAKNTFDEFSIKRSLSKFLKDVLAQASIHCKKKQIRCAYSIFFFHIEAKHNKLYKWQTVIEMDQYSKRLICYILSGCRKLNMGNICKCCSKLVWECWSKSETVCLFSRKPLERRDTFTHSQ